MALLDARNARAAFDMTTLATTPIFSTVNATPTHYEYQAFSANKFTLTGSGIMVDSAGHALSGTITKAIIDLGNNGSPDLTISGFSTGLKVMTGASANFWKAMISGNDIIYAPTAYGGTLFGDFLVSTGNVTAGHDSMVGAGPNQTLVADAYTTGRGVFIGGNDTVVSRAIRGNDSTIVGDVKQSYLTDLHGGNDVLTGSDTRSDLIVGDVQLHGSTLVGGMDSIYGRGGNDTLYGDAQTDRFSTGGFASTYLMVGGDDTIRGGAGNDRIVGDSDCVNTQGGDDVLYGDDGDDVIIGDFTSRLDNFYPGITPTNGEDLIFGGAGNDVIYGDFVTFIMADGTPSIDGAGAADVIDGGTGNDTMTGNGGADTFVFSAAAGNDIVTDFQDDIDTLKISDAYGFADANAVVAATTANGNDAIIHLSANDTVTLTDYLAAHIIGDLENDIVLA